MLAKNVPVPTRLQKRPLDERGFLITYVTTIGTDGKPDFRIIDHFKVIECIEERICGLCGESIGPLVSLIGGEECVVRRQFSDPPMHPECARYASQVCPFLTNQNAKYHNRDNPPAGIEVFSLPHISSQRPKRMAIYTTRAYDIMRFRTPGSRMVHCAIKPQKAVLKLEWF